MSSTAGSPIAPAASARSRVSRWRTWCAWRHEAPVRAVEVQTSCEALIGEVPRMTLAEADLQLTQMESRLHGPVSAELGDRVQSILRAIQYEHSRASSAQPSGSPGAGAVIGGLVGMLLGP